MLSKILIANRGEIAVRVIRAARRLGIATVAVYSEADAGSLHVAMADSAYCVGPAPARESYLNVDAIVAAIKDSGVDAVHPGYGFLSENADFAESCAAAGAVFIGPPADAIRAMGSKSAAKTIMGKADVPMLPGYHGKRQDMKTLARAAERIGYPVMVKASAGGGGMGIRIVEDGEALEDAVKGAKRQAKAAFGDDRMLIEKYLGRPRHVEIQVFADSHGNAVHLFERDCSIQRRHQKVVEEAPAPGMTATLRRRMGEAAVAAARAIGYQGAGTVEFLLDEDGSFYFMEMNTRLQVEHPVTEMITGEDLVEWQLKVAAGDPLPRSQEELTLSGHAIEVRIYAENPAKNFLPASGRIRHLRTPAESAHVRIDTGYRDGDDVTPFYDPMIAKLIVWDEDRLTALRRLRTALADYQVIGPITNIEFLGAIATHPAFAAGDVDTGFIDRHKDDLLPRSEGLPDTVLAVATLDVLLRRAEEAGSRAHATGDPHSPWGRGDAWRLNDDNRHVLAFIDGKDSVRVVAHVRGDGFIFDLPGGSVAAQGEIDPDGDLIIDLDGVRGKATVARHGEELTVIWSGIAYRVTQDAGVRTARRDAPTGGFLAPMPGKIIAVTTEPGARVRRGAQLMVLEAMKMEHAITAPTDGKVAVVNYAVGDQVEEGAVLLAFEAS